MIFKQRKAKLHNGTTVREGDIVSFVSSDAETLLGSIKRRPDKTLYFWNISQNIKDYKSAFLVKRMEKIDPKQRTFIYCSCGNELCSDGSFISDTYDENGDNHVKYKCKVCGSLVDYNFDIAPVPINWISLKSDRILDHDEL